MKKILQIVVMVVSLVFVQKIDAMQQVGVPYTCYEFGERLNRLKESVLGFCGIDACEWPQDERGQTCQSFLTHQGLLEKLQNAQTDTACLEALQIIFDTCRESGALPQDRLQDFAFLAEEFAALKQFTYSGTIDVQESVLSEESHTPVSSEVTSRQSRWRRVVPQTRDLAWCMCGAVATAGGLLLLQQRRANAH